MLAEVLKEKRKAAGLSQGDVAKALGYRSPQFVSNWERSMSVPPVYALKKIAKIYKLNIDEIKALYFSVRMAEFKADLEKKFSRGA